MKDNYCSFLLPGHHFKCHVTKAVTFFFKSITDKLINQSDKLSLYDWTLKK